MLLGRQSSYGGQTNWPRKPRSKEYVVKKVSEYLLGLLCALADLAMAIVFAFATFMFSGAWHLGYYRESLPTHWANHLWFCLAAGFLIQVGKIHVENVRKEDKATRAAKIASWTLSLIQAALHEKNQLSVQTVTRKYADERLMDLADKVNSWQRMIIALQRGGLEAVRKMGYIVLDFPQDDWGPDLVSSRRNEVMAELEEKFKDAQNSFYSRYDFYVDVGKWEFGLELRSRDWKSYLVETPAEKAS